MSKLEKAGYILFGAMVIVAVVWASTMNPKLLAIALRLLRDTAIVVIYVFAAWGLGAQVRKYLGHIAEGIEGTLASIGVGLGCYGVTLFFVGTLGILYQPLIIILIFSGVLSALKPAAPVVKAISDRLKQAGKIEVSFVEISLAAIGLLIGFSALLGVLMPEIFYDSLYHHDAFANLYLIRHRIEIFPYGVNSAMPAYVNLLYLPLMSFGDELTLKLGHFAFYIGSCLWIFTFARREYGREAGLVAAIIYGSLPGVGITAGWGMVDHGVTFFSIGALCLLAGWIFDEEEKRGLLLFSAVMLGVAVGSKYSALAVGAVAALGIVAGAVKRGGSSRKMLIDVLIFGGVSLAVASPWYIRNLIVFHNPLYPALESAESAGRFAYMNLKHDSAAPYAWLQTFWKLPKDMVVGKGVFGAGAQVWPGILLIFIGAIWGLFRKGFSRWVSICFLLLFLLWSRSVLMVRYLYPALAIGSVVTGGMLIGSARRRVFVAGSVIATIVIALIGTYGVVKYHESYYGGTIRYLTSSMTADKYMARKASHSIVAKWVRENIPKHGTKLLFVGETRAYYFGHNYEPMSAYDRHPLAEWIREAGSPGQLKINLARKGFTHLVYRDSEFKRLNKSYRHCTLNKEEMRIFTEFMDQATLVVKAGDLKVCSLE